MLFRSRSSLTESLLQDSQRLKIQRRYGRNQNPNSQAAEDCAAGTTADTVVDDSRTARVITKARRRTQRYSSIRSMWILPVEASSPMVHERWWPAIAFQGGVCLKLSDELLRMKIQNAPRVKHIRYDKDT
jgi:hypothetical protein